MGCSHIGSDVRWAAIMSGSFASVASSGVVQGVIIGATLAFLTTILILDAVAKSETRTVNGAGKRFSGEHVYRLHFPPGQLPPNDAFWSLTATDTVGYMLSNPIGRSSVDDHSGLATNADGSVDILLQPQEPSGPAQNWLPIPTGRFKLMLRAYLPGVAIVDGSYEVPPVVQVS